MSAYLQKRGSVYYFRRPVPLDIRKFFKTSSGKRLDEWVWSLRTKDRATAKSLIPRHVIKTEQLIADARAGLIEPSVSNHLLDTQLNRRKASADHAMSEVQLELEKLAYKDVQEHHHLKETDPDYAAKAVVRGEAARIKQREQELEFLTEIKWEKALANKLSIFSLFDQYAAIAGRNPKTMAQWKSYIKSLVLFVGHDDANTLTYDQVVAWRNHLRDTVNYKGKPLTAKTINGSYLGSVSALFAWAKGDGLIAKNPTIEVTSVKLPKQPKLREKAFTKDCSPSAFDRQGAWPNYRS